VRVENELWNCFFGKRELPTKAECREWALLLGVPDEYRGGKVTDVFTHPDPVCMVDKNG